MKSIVRILFSYVIVATILLLAFLTTPESVVRSVSPSFTLTVLIPVSVILLSSVSAILNVLLVALVGYCITVALIV